MKLKISRWLLAVLIAALIVISLETVLRQKSRTSFLTMETCESPDFREQALKPELYETINQSAGPGKSFSDLLTSTMLQGDFYPEEFSPVNDLYLQYKPKEYKLLRSCYEAVWGDVQCFPVLGEDISFEDSFGEPRNFGQKRVHEGCDLFGEVEIPGYYPVLSMTDGTVEKIGWLMLGGYRIGIRSPGGGYFYYAHLSEYEKTFQIGEEVKKGDILGYMGNTGYGEEGTTGAFPVHLHLGIYIRTPGKEELSVNPYWVLLSVRKYYSPAGTICRP